MKAPFFTTGEYEEKTMGRRELRESIFQLLFMTEFNDNQEMAEQKQLYLETIEDIQEKDQSYICLLYTSPSPRDGLLTRMPSSA